MKRIKTFIRNALFGGLLVILPVVIIGFVFRWIFYFVTDLIQPMTDYTQSQYGLPEPVADGLVILFILGICFLVGTLIRTSIGKWLHGIFDKYLVRLAPGYKMVREIVTQVFGSKEDSPFAKGEVVKVKLFGENCPTCVTGLVTAKHADGTVTFFMPTGPNPTSGNIYHVPETLVSYISDASVEQMMKTIIACGAGSEKLFALETTRK